jgi:hypothetical protein
VALIKNPASPFDTSKPIPVSFDSIAQPYAIASTSSAKDSVDASPAFTSG